MKYIKKIVMLVFAASVIAIGAQMGSMHVWALELRDDAEDAAAIQLMYVNTDTCLYERADDQSAVLLQLHAQDVVVPVEIGVPWIKVMLGEISGYVRSEYVQIENPDPLAIRELEDQAAYDVEFINEIDRLTKEQKRSRIYGILMIIAVVGIFAVGIVGTVIGRKKSGTQRKEP